MFCIQYSCSLQWYPYHDSPGLASASNIYCSWVFRSQNLIKLFVKIKMAVDRLVAQIPSILAREGWNLFPEARDVKGISRHAVNRHSARRSFIMKNNQLNISVNMLVTWVVTWHIHWPRIPRYPLLIRSNIPWNIITHICKPAKSESSYCLQASQHQLKSYRRCRYSAAPHWVNCCHFLAR